ncbi:hypothetical protein GGI25_002821 [Coemansia spiralis]|uniref:Bromo domain-containing protein n=2 Tax=Coemansia TaxID=4863 RepID=A0A9W8G7L5_9FUNG|nr:hypothetical protein EDC05_004916 [Coemansia umbellata]KAJ2622332.1 hypothetical protein GGI26_003343 [Coemansia sp. RSA 1358]KAJ2677869.1 hypothetical protein GGI25_002821 [Coemansia spiralis]
MSSSNGDSAHWVSTETESRHKRPRQDEPFYVDGDHSRYKHTHGAEPSGDRGTVAPTKPLTKIKLSLKLGALRKQTQHEASQISPTTAVTHRAISYDDEYGDNERYSDDDESVDIDDAEEEYSSGRNKTNILSADTTPGYIDASPHALDSLSPNRLESANESRAPRIKLRLSLKPSTKAPPGNEQSSASPTGKASLRYAAQDPPKAPLPQTRNGWADSYAANYQPSPLATGFSSVVPGSPSESLASNSSSVYNRRFSGATAAMHVGQTTYSPSRASDGDSDDNIPEYQISDADGHTYEHAIHTEKGVSSTSAPKSAGPRRRGRPPLRGKRSFSSTRLTGSVSAAVQRPLSTFTTTVSLKSSLMRLITRIRKRDSYGFFLEPVNTHAIPDYLNVIKQPMDLGTIQRKVHSNAYMGIDEFRQDIVLVCDNACKYNGAGSIYAKSAERVLEYATVAIDRETVKLERVGMASISVRASGHDSDSLYGSPHPRSYVHSHAGSRSHSPPGSVSPRHDSAAEEHSDSRIGGEGRRSSRLRWRGGSESQSLQQQQQLVDPTPASIVENFKWIGASKKKSKRVTAVPKRMTESQTKVSLLADGSIDSTGFEDEVAQFSFDNGQISAPFIASTASSANALFAHGRYYTQAAFNDYGPNRATVRNIHADADAFYGDLQSIHGDSLGLAYWSSMSDFIEGAGGEVMQYASTVMDHLTNSGHSVVRSTLEYLSLRSANNNDNAVSGDAEETKESGSICKHSTDGGLNGVEFSELIDWLESRQQRDIFYAQRREALTKQMSLRDVSAKCANGESKHARLEQITESQKQDIFARNSKKLKELYMQQQLQQLKVDGELALDELDALEASIYALSEQMCLALTGSKLPTAQIPALKRPPIKVQPKAAMGTSLATRPAPRATITASASAARPSTAVVSGAPMRTLPSVPLGNESAIHPRPNRTMSTPSLPTLQSASLASAVQSDLIKELASNKTDLD